MIVKIYDGEKVSFVYGTGYRCYITCKDGDDIDTVYSGLAESIELKNPDRDEIDFEDLKDDDVKTFLEDAKKQGFISDYEIEKEVQKEPVER